MARFLIEVTILVLSVLADAVGLKYFLYTVVTKFLQKKSDHLLVTDYLTKTPLKSFDEKETLFCLFQLLAFIRTNQLKPKKKDFVGLENHPYYSFEFLLSNYLDFTGMKDMGGKGHNRRKKVRYGLMRLQRLTPLIDQFSEEEFKSCMIIPTIDVVKKGKFLVVQLVMAKQLYDYQFPYLLPKSFLLYRNKYDLQVKFELLKSFSSHTLKKEIHLEIFMNQFKISNQKKKKIKTLFIKVVKDLDEFIEPTFEITKKDGSVFDTKKLTLQLIKQSRIISFYESIKLIKF